MDSPLLNNLKGPLCKMLSFCMTVFFFYCRGGGGNISLCSLGFPLELRILLLQPSDGGIIGVWPPHLMASHAHDIDLCAGFFFFFGSTNLSSNI